jgi:dGTPase
MSPEIKPYVNCLADKAYHSSESVSRISLSPMLIDTDLVLENPDNPYVLDQTKILQSKAFRRLANKTQVFFDPDNPHIRNRASHTYEVTSIGIAISDLLGLNTDLVRASTLGHDLGHAPTGHLFEQTISPLTGVNFRHERFGPVVAAFIERGGNGLNLTKETLKGMYEHSRGGAELTTDGMSLQESLVAMYSDKIAYITSDINDLRRQNLFSESDYRFIDSLLPGTQRDRVNQCITALIQESSQMGRVSFKESDVAINFSKVKDLMHNYYQSLNRRSLAENIKTVYGSLDEIPQLQRYDKTILIGLMTDRELHQVNTISCNKRLSLDDLRNFGVFEIIDLGFLEGQTYTDLDQRVYQEVYAA